MACLILSLSKDEGLGAMLADRDAAMSRVLDWLRRRAENVAVALLCALFFSFVVQIAARYVFNNPLSWTLEACLTAWLWLVFWAAAFVLDERDHVRFDVIYVAVRERMRRALALASALAIVTAFVISLPASLDYITFYEIKKSATLGIRLDIVFSVYALFALAVIVRYGLRTLALLRGRPMDAIEDGPRA